MLKVKSVFITGANRGIGFDLVKQIISKLKPENTFATYRDPNNSKELTELASQNSTLHLIQFDAVRDLENINEVVNTVDKATNGAGLNLLINNAGISSKSTRLSGVRKEQLMECFEVNTVAPILITKAFLPLLEKASASSTTTPGIGQAAIVNISSILGSIDLNDSGGLYAYRCSKVALNMATKSMSQEFKKSNIIAVTLHPGWVQTRLGGPKAPLTTIQSAEGIVEVIKNLDASSSGKFIQYDGKELSW